MTNPTWSDDVLLAAGVSNGMTPSQINAACAAIAALGQPATVTGTLNTDGGAAALVGAVPYGGGNRGAFVGNSIQAQQVALRNIDSAPSWAPAAVIAPGAEVWPQFHDLTGGVGPIKWICTTGGTTDVVEPLWKWSDPVGTTYTDGTVVWTAQAQTVTPWASWAWGYWHMAQAMSGQRIDEVCVVGRSGKTSDVILAYHDRMLACNPDWVFYFNVFENDCTAYTANLPRVIANWNNFVACVDKARALGKRCVVATLFPSANIDTSVAFTGYVSGNGTKIWQWLNDRIREFCYNRNDVILWDAAQLYVDSNPANPLFPDNTTAATSAAAVGQALKMTDGIHPTDLGAWALATRGGAGSLVNILLNKAPQQFHFLPTNNAWQITVNPLNYGTAGTRDATIGSGNVPNSMTAKADNATAGSTSVSSVARTDISTLSNWCRINGVAAAAVAAADALDYNYTATPGPGTFSAGDVVQSFSEIRIGTTPTLLTACAHLLRFLGAASQWVYTRVQTSADLDWSSIADFPDDGTTVLTLKSPPVIIPSGVTGIAIFQKAYWRGAAAVVADFGRNAFRLRRSEKSLT